MISYLSSSANFFLMFRTVVSLLASEEEDLPLFVIWITSLFCPMVRRFRLEKGYSPVDIDLELDRLINYDVQLMYGLYT